MTSSTTGAIASAGSTGCEPTTLPGRSTGSDSVAVSPGAGLGDALGAGVAGALGAGVAGADGTGAAGADGTGVGTAGAEGAGTGAAGATADTASVTEEAAGATVSSVSVAAGTTWDNVCVTGVAGTGAASCAIAGEATKRARTRARARLKGIGLIRDARAASADPRLLVN